jgi:hypothetical protein
MIMKYLRRIIPSNRRVAAIIQTTDWAQENGIIQGKKAWRCWRWWHGMHPGKQARRCHRCLHEIHPGNQARRCHRCLHETHPSSLWSLMLKVCGASSSDCTSSTGASSRVNKGHGLSYRR